MSYTLVETLLQIDPHVQLNDGHTVATVACRLMQIDPRDTGEYALDVDSMGRLLIYRLNFRGFPVRPAAFVEEKLHRPAQTAHAPLGENDFGFSIPGYV